MSSENIKDSYKELTLGQKLGGVSLKTVALALLATTIVVCVLTTLEAISLQPESIWDRYKSSWVWTKPGSGYYTYMGIAIGTGVGVIPLTLFAIYAVQRKVYPKKLTASEIETLRGGDFHKVRTLLFWDEYKGWSQRRIASLETGFKKEQLTSKQIKFFDDLGLRFHNKLLEIEKFEETSSVKGKNGVLPPMDNRSSKKKQADYAFLKTKYEERANLNAEWTEGQNIFLREGELDSI